jgi:hypothetical protein
MAESREMDVTDARDFDETQEFMDAIDAASDQDQMTWVKRDGRKIAAIVPVSEAEAIEVANAVMSDPQVMGAIREAVEGARKT